MLAGFALATGALIMSDTATAADEPKKEEKKDPTKDASYDEKVSVRRFVNGKLLTNPAKDVPAFRLEKGGALKFYTKAKTAATPTVGTEITDKDGTVFVVERVVENGGLGFHMSEVKAKPKDK
jgi:hypothetical protein